MNLKYIFEGHSYTVKFFAVFDVLRMRARMEYDGPIALTEERPY